MRLAFRAADAVRRKQFGSTREVAMTLVEIAIAVALLGLIAAAAIAALTVLNKNAASARLMSNARDHGATQHRSSDRLTFYLEYRARHSENNIREWKRLGSKQAGAVR